MRVESKHSSSVCTNTLKRPEAADIKNLRDVRFQRADRDSFQLSPEARKSLSERITLQPMSPSEAALRATGTGYASRPEGGECRIHETQRAALHRVGELHHALGQIKADYCAWRDANPNAPEPSNGHKNMSEILELPAHEQCVHIVAIIIHNCPHVVDEMSAACPGHGHSEPGHATIPGGEIPGQRPSTPTQDATRPAPQPGQPAPAQGGDFLSYLGQTFGPLLQLFGPIAQFIGPLLSNPMVQPILMAAVAAIPGVGPAIAPFIPVIAPIAGSLLTMAGGMASGAAPGAPGAAPGAAPGFDLNALLGGIGGMLGAAPTAAAPTPAPVPVA